MKKILLLFAFVVSTTNIFAKEGLPDFIHLVDGIYYQYIDGEAWVSRSAHYGYEDEILWDYNCYSGQLVIPEKVGGYTVVGILKAAFDRCDQLTSITFPSTVKTIGEDAFYNLTALTELTIPATIESIGDGAFKYSGLKKLTIADGDTPLKMGNGGSGYESMFSYQKVASLEEVYIGRPIEITSGNKDLFYCCNIKKVTVGSSVTEIPDGWFHWCSSLQQFTASDKLKRIGNKSFQLCKELTSFKADGLEEIGEDAFTQCEKLSTLALSPKLTTIGASAFYGTTALTELTIPASVTSIGEGAFKYSGLKKLTFADGDQILQMGKGGSGNESMFSYRKVEYLEEVYIGRNIQLTGGDGDLFYSLRGLKKVTFGDVCTEVPDGWFSQCTGLEEVTLGRNATHIGNRAFKNCEMLNYFAGYPTIKSIGDEAFFGCKAAPYWDFSNDPVETIGASAFYWNTSLKGVILPATLKSIADGGFYGCDALKEITCLAVVPPACGNNVFRYLDTSKCKLLVPEGSIDAYKAAEVWKEFFNIEPTGINRVEADASAAEWYSINGQRSSSARKGLNIMRTADGKTRKVIVR